jgi:GntR family transcriptional regulator
MSRSRYAKPLRYQIRRDVLDFIAEQGYQPGDQLPSELELSDRLEVSRFSLREAIHLLEEERIISTRHGTGRFLLSKPSDLSIDLTNLQSVTELLTAYSIPSVNELLKVERQPANPEYAGALSLELGKPVVVISRLRYAEKIPVIYSLDILAESILPEAWSEADFSGSLFDYLREKCSIRLDHSQTKVRAVMLDPEDTPFANELDAPWILLEQVIFSQLDIPIVYSKDFHRGDYISFNVRRIRR